VRSFFRLEYHFGKLTYPSFGWLHARHRRERLHSSNDLELRRAGSLLRADRDHGATHAINPRRRKTGAATGRQTAHSRFNTAKHSTTQAAQSRDASIREKRETCLTASEENHHGCAQTRLSSSCPSSTAVRIMLSGALANHRRCEGRETRIFRIGRAQVGNRGGRLPRNRERGNGGGGPRDSGVLHALYTRLPAGFVEFNI
jgi:hypothetical protein